MRTKLCPFCKQWIQLPLRRADLAFADHKRECDPAGYRRQREYAAELLGDPPPTDEELEREARKPAPRPSDDETMVRVGLGTISVSNADRARIARWYDKRGYAKRGEVQAWAHEVIRRALKELD